MILALRTFTQVEVVKWWVAAGNILVIDSRKTSQTNQSKMLLTVLHCSTF